MHRYCSVADRKLNVHVGERVINHNEGWGGSNRRAEFGRGSEGQSYISNRHWLELMGIEGASAKWVKFGVKWGTEDLYKGWRS